LKKKFLFSLFPSHREGFKGRDYFIKTIFFVDTKELPSFPFALIV